MPAQDLQPQHAPRADIERLLDGVADLDLTLDTGVEADEPATSLEIERFVVERVALGGWLDRRTQLLLVAGLASFVWGFAFMIASALLI